MQVYIVEDSRVFRERLVSLLEEVEGLEIAGFSASAKGTAENIIMRLPDVLLLDIGLADGNGLDILATVQRHKLKTVTMVMTLDFSSVHQKRAMDCGAEYFFDKAKDLWKIPLAIEQMIAAKNKV